MNLSTIEIKELAHGTSIPYDLLLLADETVESINEYLIGSEIYVATLPEESKPIAAMVLLPINEEEIEIMNIAVDTPLQSQSIGKILLDKAMKIAEEKGYTSLKVGTGDCGIRQLKFSQQNGFKICGVRKDYFTDKFPEPIYENGVMLKDMVVLERKISGCPKDPPPTPSKGG